MGLWSRTVLECGIRAEERGSSDYEWIDLTYVDYACVSYGFLDLPRAILG